MTREQLGLLERYKEKMAECVADHDAEEAHKKADDLLVELLNELGFKEVTRLFDEVKKFYA